MTQLDFPQRPAAPCCLASVSVLTGAYSVAFVEIIANLGKVCIYNITFLAEKEIDRYDSMPINVKRVSTKTLDQRFYFKSTSSWRTLGWS